MIASFLPFELSMSNFIYNTCSWLETFTACMPEHLFAASCMHERVLLHNLSLIDGRAETWCARGLLSYPG